MSTEAEYCSSADPGEPTGAETPADALGATKRMSSLDEDDNQSDGVPCPTCGKLCNGRRGVSIHHVMAHGESIAGFEVTCAWCREGMTVQQRNEGDDPNYFCDQECYGKWYSENRSGENHPCWKGGLVTVECSYCGDEKEVKPHETEGRSHHFCDRGCMGRWQSENRAEDKHPSWTSNFEPCAWCGDSVKVKPHRAELYELHFCDGRCKGQWQSENLNGEANPYWNGGYEQDYGPGWGHAKRERIRERDGYECQSCGISQGDYMKTRLIKLDVHHIVPAEQFDDPEKRNHPDNLITLCRSCHRKWEGIPLRPEVIT